MLECLRLHGALKQKIKLPGLVVVVVFFFLYIWRIHIRKQKNKKHQYFYKAFQINFIDSKTLWSIIFLISPL